ncbi:MAG: hypothetical protein ACK56I_01425, partial [bacterium]
KILILLLADLKPNNFFAGFLFSQTFQEVSIIGDADQNQKPLAALNHHLDGEEVGQVVLDVEGLAGLDRLRRQHQNRRQ